MTINFKAPEIKEDGSHLKKAWDGSMRWSMTGRTPMMLAKLFYAHTINPAITHWGHQAAYQYDVEAAMDEIKQPILVLNPEDDLWNEEDVNEINNIDNMLNDSSSSKSSRRPSYEQLEVEAMPRSSGTANYVTPAIKRWYVLCGVCPEGIEFRKGERQLAFVWKIIGFIASVILTPAAVYSALEGYRMDEPIKIILKILT